MVTLEPMVPSEVRNYTFDWSVFLGTDTIVTSDVTVSGITLEEDTNDDTSVTVLVSGGTINTVATITNTITTDGGLTETQTFLLPIIPDEPVSLEEAKQQVRMVEDDSEDAFIASLIAPARAYVERCTRRLFVGGTRTETFTRWGDYLEIWRSPIVSVDAVTYSTTADSADDAAYTGFVSNLGFPARISPAVDDTFPDLTVGGTITVEYTAGALSATSEEYLNGKRAILLLIGFWFDNRGEVPLNKDVKFALDCILDDLAPVSAY